MKLISFVFSFKNEENNLEELIKRVDTSVKKLKNYKLLFLPFEANERNKSFATINSYLKILLKKSITN